MDVKNKNMYFKCEVGFVLYYFWGRYYNYIYSEL